MLTDSEGDASDMFNYPYTFGHTVYQRRLIGSHRTKTRCTENVLSEVQLLGALISSSRLSFVGVESLSFSFSHREWNLNVPQRVKPEAFPRCMLYLLLYLLWGKHLSRFKQAHCDPQSHMRVICCPAFVGEDSAGEDSRGKLGNKWSEESKLKTSGVGVNEQSHPFGTDFRWTSYLCVRVESQDDFYGQQPSSPRVLGEWIIGEVSL